MRTLSILIIFSLSLFACTKQTIVEPAQPIITSDTSQNTGRLIVKLFDINNAFVHEGDVKLFSSYEDIQRDFPLLNIKSKSDGIADFGYILIGNYYITAGKDLGGTRIADTTAAQVISQKVTQRYMILN